MLEALAATSLIAFTLLGFAANSISLIQAEKNADSTSVATALALHEVELLRSMPLGAAAHAPGNYVDANNPLRADGTAGGIFNRTWTVSANDTPRFGVKTVTVTVSWRDSLRAPAPHSTRVTAYVRCINTPC
jgi:Tfp pilus assembly protein PilV